jgi:hypothetical protein
MALLRTGFDAPFKKLDASGFDLRFKTPEEPKAAPARTPPRSAESLEKVELTKEYFNRVDKAHDQFCKTMATGAEMSFLIGKALFQIKMKRDQGIFWKDFVRDNFKFSLWTADSHIRMYERFKDDPESVRGKTIAELNGGKERAGRGYAQIAGRAPPSKTTASR